MTEKVVWHVVKEFAAKLGVPKLAPHDLRRSCARLCHTAGGELEQIQFLLGHVSVQTTEKYYAQTPDMCTKLSQVIDNKAMHVGRTQHNIRLCFGGSTLLSPIDSDLLRFTVLPTRLLWQNHLDHER